MSRSRAAPVKRVHFPGRSAAANASGGSRSGISWSYVDEDGNGQNVVADSAFILEWTELNDLNPANDAGKTDLEPVFSEEPDSVTAERWPAEDRRQNFGNGYPEGESVSVEHAESWSIVSPTFVIVPSTVAVNTSPSARIPVV